MKKQKTIITTLVILALAVTGVFIYWSRGTVEDSQDKPEQIVQEGTPSESTTENDDRVANSTLPEVKTTEEDDNPEPERNDDFSPVITRVSNSNDNLVVKAYVPTFNKGTCVLEIMDGEEIITSREAETLAQPSYLQCDGFSIPKSEIPKGEWKLRILYKLEGKTYASDEQNLSL